jgi:hypothetical protein
MPDDKVSFSFDWLAGAAAKRMLLTVCPDGHLVVRGNTHWAPVAVSLDLNGLVCHVVQHKEAG